MGYPWDWSVFQQDTGAGETYLQWMLSAWGWTLKVSALAWLVALLFGVAVGVLRTLPGRGARWFGAAWVELFRNIPVLVQVFLWYHVAPTLVPALKGVPGFVMVVLGLGCFTSSRVAEQVRAGIEALPRGQRLAGLAIGLTLPQTYRHVLLPMALRLVIPPLTSEAMNIVKNSSVAFAVSIPELIQFAMQAQEETAHGVEVYLAVTALYVLSALLVNRVMALVEARMQVGR
jgi:glutamate/aspartate transport system permease protein